MDIEQINAIGNALVFEDPFDKSDFEGYRKLRKQVKTHVAHHLGDPHAMIRVIKEDAASVFNTGGNPGISGVALAPVMASARRRLALICGISEPGTPNMYCVCPEINSVSACEAAL